MIAVGHQPQYIPYLGFFNKLNKADVFIFVDNVQFNRKSWQQRTLIKYRDKPLFLTIPVRKKGRYYQKINEVEIIDGAWRKKHWKSICLAYDKTQYFDKYSKDLEAIYSRNWLKLSDFTIHLTRYFMEVIGIRPKKIYLGSELGIQGEKTTLLIDICRKTGCNTYLSGEGAKVYVDEYQFEQNNFKHIFNRLKLVKYGQPGEEFLEGMGIIEALFIYGAKTIDLIRKCSDD